MDMSLDEADRIILAEIQKNATQSLENLAFACHLSVASVQRRLKKLRDNKVIEREVALLNPSALGYNMTFIIMVELERERMNMLDAFKRKVKSEPLVQQSYYITGDADFTLICVAKNMEDFESLTHRLFFDDDNVRRFRTSVVMNRTKIGLEVPLIDVN